MSQMRIPRVSVLLLVLGTLAGTVSAASAAAGALGKLQPTAPGAEVWRANMGVTIAPTKDAAAKTITYVFEATNLGDDDARQVVMAAHFGAGVTVATSSVSGFDSCSTPGVVGNGSRYIQCSLSSLGVRAKAKLTVTVSNPTNGTAQASAQVYNLSPDPIVDNNYAHVWVP